MAQYIDKDILATEIKRCIDDELQTIKKFTLPFYATEITRCNARIVLLNQLQNFLDTIEAKEVDFIKEFYTFSEKHKLMDKDIEFSDIEKTASFFYQLGLKAKKGKIK